MGLAQGVAGPGMAGKEEGDGSKTAGKRATQASSAGPGTPGRELNSAQGSGAVVVGEYGVTDLPGDAAAAQRTERGLCSQVSSEAPPTHTLACEAVPGLRLSRPQFPRQHPSTYTPTTENSTLDIQGPNQLSLSNNPRLGGKRYGTQLNVVQFSVQRPNRQHLQPQHALL